MSHRTKAATLFAAACALVFYPAFSTADDFGKILKKAAQNVLEDVAAPPPRANPNRGAQPGSPAPGQGAPARPAPSPMVPGSPQPRNQPVSGLSGARDVPKGDIVPVKTPDGWTIVAHHFRPAGKAKAGASPVILCHGLTYNAMFWNLDASASLPAYLTQKGYDVWVVDLRGSGLSQKWVWNLEEAPEVLIGGALRKLTQGKIGPQGYATVDPKAANWSLDQHIAYDVPAFVKLVKQQTGAPDVTWLGHSMGGIVAICHLARYGNPGIGRLVTVGSQVTMPNGQVPLQFIGEMIQTRGLQLSGQLRGEELLSQSRTSVHNLFFNQENVSPAIYEALGSWATDIPAVALMQQYNNLAMKGELLDGKGQYSYAKNLKNITIPVLFTCGSGDQFAPPVCQKFLYDNVGSTDKSLVIFGRRGGFSADAGHDDALLGLNSRSEVYPAIDRWLGGERK